MADPRGLRVATTGATHSFLNTPPVEVSGSNAAQARAMPI
jgi:hypothetical protein